MTNHKWLKGIRIYYPLGEGVCAPEGYVWEDLGDEVEVCCMTPIGGAKSNVLRGVQLIPKDKLRLDRRGKTQPAYNEVPMIGVP